MKDFILIFIPDSDTVGLASVAAGGWMIKLKKLVAARAKS